MYHKVRGAILMSLLIVMEELNIYITAEMRQVQKSDRINSDHQSGSDQLGSTRIDSDHKKIKNNKEMRLLPV